jgi:hypothetical protein
MSGSHRERHPYTIVRSFGSDHRSERPPGATVKETLTDAVERVTPLELFFDLVFVFTITQLSSLLVERPAWASLWHVVVMLGVISAPGRELGVSWRPRGTCWRRLPSS